MAIVEITRPVTGGVDTHLDAHVAAVLDLNGAVLGVESFPADQAGYAALREWLVGFGDLQRVGVEGTGAYGAGLARHLWAAGVEVIEVDRPDRQARRRAGKSDPLDAVEAARSALSGRARAIAKTKDGSIEAIRALMVAKRSARLSRARTLTQMRHLSFTAPEQLRVRFARLAQRELVAQAVALRPRPGADEVVFATKTALASLARRVVMLDDEIDRLDTELERLVTMAAPSLLECFGVGVDTAAILLAAAGDNPQRIRSEAAWAHMCGVAPIPRLPGGPSATGSTPPGTDKRTTPSGASC